MMQRRYLFGRLLGLFLFLTPFLTQAQGSLRANPNYKLEHFTLPNGLQVYINEDQSLPQVFGAVAVRCGGKYDPKDNTGQAHYLEHMLFKGTDQMGTFDYAKEKPLMDEVVRLYDELGKTKDEAARKVVQEKINEASLQAAAYAIPNEIDRLVNSIGGKEMNAFTSWEMVVYHNSFPAHQSEKWLDLYAGRFINPVFRLFQSELETVYEEKNRSMDNFGDAIFETFLKNFFKHHPYGQQTILGETEHLKNPSLTAMYSYYNTYYVANNMALFLSGPVKAAELRPLIEKKFGVWKRGDLPAFGQYPEAPFNGREVVKAKLSPIKLGVLGWRTVPSRHADEDAMTVMAGLLSNEGETGFFDRLRLDNHILAAQIVPFTMLDHGGYGVFYVPKIVGQSLDKAEALVRAQFDSLKAGRFTDAQLAAVKNNLIKNHYRSLEGAQGRGMSILSVFIEGRKWDDILDYEQALRKITRDDVIRVCKQYFGDNFLALHSKMGFPKKDKLDKPDFKPVTPKEGVKSPYMLAFEKLPDGAPKSNFVNFSRDLSETNLGPNRTLYYTQNPLNDIFTLSLRFGLGSTKNPALPLTADYLNNIGCGGRDVKAFKQAVYNLGCSYSTDVDGDYFTLSLEGLEENLPAALVLLNDLMQTPETSAKARQVALEELKSARKVEKGEPATMGRILREYLAYGAAASYKTRYSYKQSAALTPARLIEEWRKVQGMGCELHYAGRKSAADVAQLLRDKLTLPAESTPSTSPEILPVQTYAKPEILFHHRKDARQSQVYFHVMGEPLGRDQMAMLDAFNAYFGDDMSSLVFQEVREYRSLAYTAYARYRQRPRPGLPGLFTGFVGCQSDKTLDALDIMTQLVRDMPQKPDREIALRSGLVQSAYSGRPSFRDLTETYVAWKRWGWPQDPNELRVPEYKNIRFADILAFYEQHLKGKTIVISIVGNKKDIDMKKLATYGTIRMVKAKEFVTF